AGGSAVACWADPGFATASAHASGKATKMKVTRMRRIGRYSLLKVTIVGFERNPSSVRHISPKDAADLDATERREWLDSLDYVLQSGGPQKVARLLRELTLYAKQNGVKLPFTANTPYLNSIPADEQALMPGSPDIERRI